MLIDPSVRVSKRVPSTKTRMSPLPSPRREADPAIKPDASTLPDGHFNKSANQRSRPNLWWSVRNKPPLEMIDTPVGVVGRATLASPDKAKRAVAAALRYLSLLIEHILEAFPPGTTPPIEEVTLFRDDEVSGYLNEPSDPGSSWAPGKTMVHE
jgi:hypothetical protein